MYLYLILKGLYNEFEIVKSRLESAATNTYFILLLFRGLDIENGYV